MSWIVVSTLPPSRGQEHLLVDALRRAGARAVEREGERYVALFPRPGEMEVFLAELRSVIRAATGLAEPELRWGERSDGEWAARWRAEQAARRVSDRVIVAPVGVDPAGYGGSGLTVREDDVIVRLDPGVAFGTAEHATTRACLALLDGRIEPGRRILDVGTGSGILAIAAALLGAGRVLALEADAVSCEAARRNVGVNRVGDRVEVREEEVTPASLKELGPFDGVVVNIEARVSAPLVPAVPAALGPDGWFVLSGVVGDERDDAVAAATAAGLRLEAERPERSWWTGVFGVE